MVGDQIWPVPIMVNGILSAEVSDTRDDDSSKEAGHIKIMTMKIDLSL